MRFNSTAESAVKGEITILAIIECVLSVALYIGFCIHFSSFRYLAWAVVVAPLMLFRTERSAQWGLSLYLHLYNSILTESRMTGWFVDRVKFLRVLFSPKGSGLLSEVVHVIFLIVETTVLALMGFVIRILSPMIWLMRRPVEGLRQAPFNWHRQCLCTDLYLAPEVVPLEHTSTNYHLKFGDLIRAFKENGVVGRGMYNFVLWPLFLGYLPPLFYRVSFKATSIVYLPFVFVVHSTVNRTLEIKQRLERFTKGEQERVRRWVAVFVLTILAAKLALSTGWVDFNYLASKFPNQRIADYVVPPGHWAWWQITLVTDAFLTFILFFFADSALAWLTAEKPWSEKVVSGTITTITFTRGTLAIFTVAELFYLVANATIPQTIKHCFP